MFLDEMKFVRIVYDLDIRHLLEGHKDVPGASPEGTIDLVLAYPIPNMKKEHIMYNPLHDIFNLEDMSDFVKLGSQVMPASSHGHFSALGCSFPNVIGG